MHRRKQHFKKPNFKKPRRSIFRKSILLDKLEEKSLDKVKLIEEVYRTVRNKLDAIKNAFPNYSEHGIEHCESVVDVLERLVIGKNNIKKSKWHEDEGIWKLYLIKDKNIYLTEDEITLLFLGILLHDIGMSPEIEANKELKEALKKFENREIEKEELEKIKEKVRKEHHKRSREFVKNDDELINILKRYNFDDYIEELANIVEGHREDPYELFSKYRNDEIRVSLLAFLIEIADDMDIGPHRVNEFIIKREIWNNLDEESIKHVIANMKSKRSYRRDNSIVEYWVTLKNLGNDLDNYTPILELVYGWWEKIENRLNRFYTICGLYGRDIENWRDILPSKVNFNFNIMGIPADFSKKFEVDKRVFAYLLSEKIYEGNWMYAFRELISNAFDAIKRRAYIEENFDNPKVDINIKFIDKEWMEITIEDNGIGMSDRDIEDYLLKVGRSFYDELRKKNLDEAKAISPAGYYGIGFLSSFMLLKNVEEDKKDKIKRGAEIDFKFEGRIEIESKRKGRKKAVKVIILNPNLPVVKFESDDEIDVGVGTKIVIRSKRKDVREFFKKLLDLWNCCNNNKKNKNEDVKMFPFIISSKHPESLLETIFGYKSLTGIINSVFNIKDRQLKIDININISDTTGKETIVWKGPITPDLFIKSNLFIKGKGKRITDPIRIEDGYTLDIWYGDGFYISQNILIPINVLENLKIFERSHSKERKPILKTNIEEISFENFKCVCCVNGILCNMIGESAKFFDFLTTCCKINNKNITIILTVETPQQKFNDFKKDGVEIDIKIISKMLNKLADKGICFNVREVMADHLITYQHFLKIGAEKFVKKCLKFKDIHNRWITIEEIEKRGKKPLVADEFIAKTKNYKKFKDFFEKNNIHLLSPEYWGFFEYYLDEYLEKCNECETCAFENAFKIKNNEFKKILKEKFGNVVAIEDRIIVDNPFIKTICNLWKNNEIDSRDVDRLEEKIEGITYDKGYLTIEDIEELEDYYLIVDYYIDEEYQLSEFIKFIKSNMNKTK